MAAITKRLLQLRPAFHSHARPYPSTHRHFSSDDDRDDAPQHEQPETDSSISSGLNAIRASLQNQPPPPQRGQPPRNPFSNTSDAPPPPSRTGSTDEIFTRLAEFRSGKYVSFEELYEKNTKTKGESSAAPGAGGAPSVDSIRQSLSSLQSTGKVNSGRSASLLLSSIAKNRADPNANLPRGSGGLIPPFQMKAAKGSRHVEFGNKPDLSIVGDKLKALRPEKRKGKWFSLQELKDRLAKMKEMEAKQPWKSDFHHAITDSIHKMKQDPAKKKGIPISILGPMGALLDEKTRPPKDHLVERYFHPDNMSSAEKLKLELQKVRDEFKMSESDCGSARVQVAQLTTKIKHLSTALHKKDKHSRKGLHEMVQRRKKLLKYLRRTDWDSYCLVLSKLGLRDNPDIKA